MYRDHRKGPGGPPGGATHPGGPHGLKWEGNQPLVGWCAPLGPPLRLGLGTLGEGAPPLALGGKSPPFTGAPPWGPYIKRGGWKGSRTLTSCASLRPLLHLLLP